ncbi:unnamed protein product [Effrenium voratum]|nr:unnamed protein product [Effrenium voratum]CAJ1448392.1 unnamed protein product [Effrenium voratum]
MTVPWLWYALVLPCVSVLASTTEPSDWESDMDKQCAEMLGLSTTTSTTVWFMSADQRKAIELHATLMKKVKQDGYQMAAEFQEWLQVRLMAMFFGFTVGTPLVVGLAYRHSSRFRKWTSWLDAWVPFRRCMGFTMVIFVIAAGASAFFSLRITWLSQNVMEDVQEYYLSSFTYRLLDDFIVESYNLSMADAGKPKQLVTQLCNPTDTDFRIQQLEVDGILGRKGGAFLTSQLQSPVVLPPHSVDDMVIEYVVIEDWNAVIAPAMGVAVASAISNYFTTDSTMLMSFVIRTDCVVRATQVYLGVRANYPLALSELPEVWNWNASYYANPDAFWVQLYVALLKGLENERVLEWDSLEVGGELMAWVYGVVTLCSVIFVSSTFMFMLLLLKQEVRCRTCRRRPPPRDLESICPEKVWGRSLADVEIEVPDEDLKSKPHLTKATTRMEAPPKWGAAPGLLQS